MEGKDSEGNDMPSYRNPEYAHFKTSINPNNRGFWDLRVTGQYQNQRLSSSRMSCRMKRQSGYTRGLERGTWG